MNQKCFDHDANNDDRDGRHCCDPSLREKRTGRPLACALCVIECDSCYATFHIATAVQPGNRCPACDLGPPPVGIAALGLAGAETAKKESGGVALSFNDHEWCTGGQYTV